MFDWHFFLKIWKFSWSMDHNLPTGITNKWLFILESWRLRGRRVTISTCQTIKNMIIVLLMLCCKGCWTLYQLSLFHLLRVTIVPAKTKKCCIFLLPLMFIWPAFYPSTFLKPVNGSKNSILNWVLKLVSSSVYFFVCLSRIKL